MRRNLTPGQRRVADVIIVISIILALGGGIALLKFPDIPGFISFVVFIGGVFGIVFSPPIVQDFVD